MGKMSVFFVGHLVSLSLLLLQLPLFERKGGCESHSLVGVARGWSHELSVHRGLRGSAVVQSVQSA